MCCSNYVAVPLAMVPLLILLKICILLVAPCVILHVLLIVASRLCAGGAARGFQKIRVVPTSILMHVLGIILFITTPVASSSVLFHVLLVVACLSSCVLLHVLLVVASRLCARVSGGFQ